MSEPTIPDRAGLAPSWKRRWWVVLAATTLAVLGGWAYVSTASPTYEATVRVLVGPVSTDFETLRASGQLAQTYSELARSRPVLAATASETGRSLTPAQLREDTRSIANDVTRIVTVKVRSGDRTSAAVLANTLAANLVDLVPASSGPEGRLRVVEPATPPTEPVWPRTSLILALAAVAGFIAALAGLWLVDSLRGAATPADGRPRPEPMLDDPPGAATVRRAAPAARSDGSG
jgi:capsular polysaccharide biosynthesis protein